MADYKNFFTTGNRKETNPATQFQNCDESTQLQNDANMLKLNKSEEDTSGHSELSGNAQMYKESIEKSEERKENKTAAGMHTMHNQKWLSIVNYL